MTIPEPKPVVRPNAFRLNELNFDHVEAQTRFLSKKAGLMARAQDVLFHGTRHRESVLTSGFLQSSPYIQTVSFTRSPKVAAHWAALPRDDDEGSGAVLVFDRASLKRRYKLECVDDGWEFDPSRHNEFWRADHDECEEQVWGRNIEIAPHLIGLISAPIPTLSRKGRAIKRAKELQLARDAADCSCGVRWQTCPDCKAEKAEKKAEQLERAHPGISMLWRGNAS